MRQAYDYWQDQPGSLGRRRETTPTTEKAADVPPRHTDPAYTSERDTAAPPRATRARGRTTRHAIKVPSRQCDFTRTTPRRPPRRSVDGTTTQPAIRHTRATHANGASNASIACLPQTRRRATHLQPPERGRRAPTRRRAAHQASALSERNPTSTKVTTPYAPGTLHSRRAPIAAMGDPSAHDDTRGNPRLGGATHADIAADRTVPPAVRHAQARQHRRTHCRAKAHSRKKLPSGKPPRLSRATATRRAPERAHPRASLWPRADGRHRGARSQTTQHRPSSPRPCRGPLVCQAQGPGSRACSRGNETVKLVRARNRPRTDGTLTPRTTRRSRPATVLRPPPLGAPLTLDAE